MVDHIMKTAPELRRLAMDIMGGRVFSSLSIPEHDQRLISSYLYASPLYQ